MEEARKRNRIYRPAFLEMTIKGKLCRIHNICEDGMAFFTGDPSFVSEGDNIPTIALCLGDLSFHVEGEIVHVSSFSHLHSNIPDHGDDFVVGVKFRREDPEGLNYMKKLLDALQTGSDETP